MLKYSGAGLLLALLVALSTVEPAHSAAGVVPPAINKPVGSLRVTIEPERSSSWTLLNPAGAPVFTAPKRSGNTQSNLSPGSYTLVFNKVPGYAQHAPAAVTIEKGKRLDYPVTLTPEKR